MTHYKCTQYTWIKSTLYVHKLVFINTYYYPHIYISPRIDTHTYIWMCSDASNKQYTRMYVYTHKLMVIRNIPVCTRTGIICTERYTLMYIEWDWW